MHQWLAKMFVAGIWVSHHRDHGGVIFIDLRDYTGVTQVVINPESKAFAIAETLRNEWVVGIKGTVALRPEGTINDRLPSGEIEVVVYLR